MLMIKIRNIRWINQSSGGNLAWSTTGHLNLLAADRTVATGRRMLLPEPRRPEMSTFAHAAETMHVATRPAIWVRVINTVPNFMRALKNRRDFYRLGEMSDAELSDIGLTRGDLNVVVDLPFGTDPTAHLGSMAEVRRIESLARFT
jgi:uncharacterized protein YjiS (DUF1127 family)